MIYYINPTQNSFRSVKRDNETPKAAVAMFTASVSRCLRCY